jgi:hypothetical protein
VVVSSFDDAVFRQLVTLHEDCQRLFGPSIGAGRHRASYLRKGLVIKVPRNDEGIRANNREVRTYRESESSVRQQLARPFHRYVVDIPVVVMQRLEMPTDYTHNSAQVPSWAHRWDCHQAGKTRRGEWKVYDYAQ